MSRTTKCGAATRHGRLIKAVRFLEQAEVVLAMADDDAEVADPAVTLLIHAGIAASDALCCAQLGEHARGESHDDAVGLLRTVDKSLADDLHVLLGMKAQAGYSAQQTSAQNLIRATRAARRLVTAARTT
ncbi:hypothetical protein [Candidatus Neomicrothrix sp.]|uniref:HEPN domain-containing protein n=1 Tax=Candidatus Neomicrothrix parvicella RN1 TaxID=1229780 RepID=R4Z2F4_9ACTN|nr:hypothetical protein [Candidatus Microthrix sp.]CCM64903.1 conserved hypothetical protein [Candidatus Microthrix parvicella RN1]MBP7405163.1 hypothetical protein [Candidatus Microthrix sp.]MBP7878191.1 hypothetical protein [Candidatus Microthrix sp.]MBP8956235.1 hypothetical protein [Candidatus Microthrix sp.]MBP9835043.1 hypothetical protein [Candidatus Microthrix sp.]